MEKTSFSLVREFSDLGCYQRRHSIRYAVETVCGQLCLTLQKVQDDKTETQRLALSGMEPGGAKQLVRFMYENALPIENWTDVLEEIIG